MQSRASSFSPMFFRVTMLLFWNIVPLSENNTSSACRREKIDHGPNVYALTIN